MTDSLPILPDDLPFFTGISPDKRIYLAYDTVGDTDYISLVDTED